MDIGKVIKEGDRKVETPALPRVEPIRRPQHEPEVDRPKRERVKEKEKV